MRHGGFAHCDSGASRVPRAGLTAVVRALSAFLVIAAPIAALFAPESPSYAVAPPPGYRSDDPIEELAAMAPHRWSLSGTLLAVEAETGADRTSLASALGSKFAQIVAAHMDYAQAYRARVEQPIQAALDASAEANRRERLRGRGWSTAAARLAAARADALAALLAAQELDRALASRLGEILGGVQAESSTETPSVVPSAVPSLVPRRAPGTPAVGDALTARFAYTGLVAVLGDRVADLRLVTGLPDLASILDRVAQRPDTPEPDRALLRAAAHAERIRGVAELDALPAAVVGAFFKDLKANADRLATLDEKTLRSLEDSFELSAEQDALAPRLRIVALRQFDAGRRIVEVCRAQMTVQTASRVADAWVSGLWRSVTAAHGIRTPGGTLWSLSHEVDTTLKAIARDPAISSDERRAIEAAVALAHTELAERAWKLAAPVFAAIRAEVAAVQPVAEAADEGGDGAIREGESPEAHARRLAMKRAARKRMGREDDSPLTGPVNTLMSEMRPLAMAQRVRVAEVVAGTLGERAKRYLEPSDDPQGESGDLDSAVRAVPTVHLSFDDAAAIEAAEAAEGGWAVDGVEQEPASIDFGEARSAESDAMEPLAPPFVPGVLSRPAPPLGLRQIDEASRTAGVRVTRACGQAALDAAIASPAGDAYRAAREELVARADALPRTVQPDAKLDFAPVFAACRALEAAARALDGAIADELEARCTVPPDSGVRALLLLSRDELGFSFLSTLGVLRELPISAVDRTTLFAAAQAELSRLAAAEPTHRAAMLAAELAAYGLVEDDGRLVRRDTDGRISDDRAASLDCERRSAVLKAVADAAELAFGADDARFFRVKTALVGSNGMFASQDGAAPVSRRIARTRLRAAGDADTLARLDAIDRALWSAMLSSMVRRRVERCGCEWTGIEGAVGRGYYSLMNGTAPHDRYRSRRALADADDAIERASLELARIDAATAHAR